MELNDWSTHLMQVEIQVKGIEKKLLHKEYDSVEAHINAAKAALDKTLAWVATQGSRANVDVIPLIENVVKALPANHLATPYLNAAVAEINQLRGERAFWLRSGYHIGSKGE